MVLDNGQMDLHVGQRDLILAFDPGRDKTGFALVNLDGELIFSGMFPSIEREKFFDALLNSESIDEFIIERTGEKISAFIERVKFIAIGNGTSSKEFYEAAKILKFEIKITDERNTTLEARNLYWKIYKPGFFLRFLPKGLRVPPRVLDDLAAWAIARRELGVIKHGH